MKFKYSESYLVSFFFITYNLLTFFLHVLQNFATCVHFIGRFLWRTTKSTLAFVGSPTAANYRLPSTGPTSAVNRPDVCRQRARQNLHRHSLGARRRQIVICRQRARRLPSTGPTKSTSVFIRSPTVANCCLPSTGPTSAVNVPDNIYTDVYW